MSQTAMLTVNRFRASLLLGAVGDTIGYHNGEWEFNYKTRAIREAFMREGACGMDIKNLIVSDDTVLHLATVRNLINVEKLAHVTPNPEPLILRGRREINGAITQFLSSFQDMSGRAPGGTTSTSMTILKRGGRPDFNLEHKTCGGSMRASAIGLRYHKYYDVNDLNMLIWCSIEYCRLTHNGPMAYMGSFLNALFTSYAINQVPPCKWLTMAIQTKGYVYNFINTVHEGGKHFKCLEWIYKLLESYRDARFPSQIDGLGAGERIEWDRQFPHFNSNYMTNPESMDKTYKALSEEPNGHYHWSGSGGISSVLIAYDALLFSIYGSKDFDPDCPDLMFTSPEKIGVKQFQTLWFRVVFCGMLHEGDNDSTGIIIGGWYGALFGARGVSKKLIHNVEYFDEMWNLGAELHRVSIAQYIPIAHAVDDQPSEIAVGSSSVSVSVEKVSMEKAYAGNRTPDTPVPFLGSACFSIPPSPSLD